jgi:hypothetical protein
VFEGEVGAGASEGGDDGGEDSDEDSEEELEDPENIKIEGLNGRDTAPLDGRDTAPLDGRDTAPLDSRDAAVLDDDLFLLPSSSPSSSKAMAIFRLLRPVFVSCLFFVDA